MARPGWYPDPAGRFPQRFFDGHGWNERVRTAEGLRFDPPPPTAEPPTGSPLSAPPTATAPIPDLGSSSTVRASAGALSRLPLSWKYGAVALAVVVLVVGWQSMATGPAPSETVSGTFAVTSSMTVLTGIMENTGRSATGQMEALDALIEGETFDCSRLYGGYSDIGAGTQVRVTDETGILLATSVLKGGVLTLEGGCAFTFNVDVPEAKMYQFEISRRGAVAYTREDLEQRGWTVHLSL